MISNTDTIRRATPNVSSYEANCRSQTRTILDSSAVIERAIIIAASNAFGREFSLADFGAGTGGNSIVLSDQVARHLLHRNPGTQLNVTRCDSRFNDFAELSNNVVASKCQPWRLAINERILCGSFYKQLLPANALNMAVSTSCLHWLSTAQQPRLHHTITSADDIEPLAKNDLAKFFTARAAELRQGGSLFATMVGTMHRGAEADHRPLALLQRAIKTLQREGLLSNSANVRSLVPIHLRTAGDVKALLTGPFCAVSHLYKVHLVEEVLIECPIYHAYLQHRDAARYGREYRGFVQGFSIRAVRRSIRHFRGDSSKGFTADDLVLKLYDTLEQFAIDSVRLSPAPTAHVRILLERK